VAIFILPRIYIIFVLRMRRLRTSRLIATGVSLGRHSLWAVADVGESLRQLTPVKFNSVTRLRTNSIITQTV